MAFSVFLPKAQEFIHDNRTEYTNRAAASQPPEAHYVCPAVFGYG